MNDIYSILHKSINSGTSGALAMAVQVTTLMPLRTTMNYQYRNGGTIKNTVSTLYKESGLIRFYRGFLPALVQAPVSRFGDTFSNTFALSLCKTQPQLQNIPIVFQTMFASIFAGSFRILLSPIDTLKTTMQVNNNLTDLKKNFKQFGPKVLFNGSMANCTATIVGHYPWFATYNYLDHTIPKYEDKIKILSRNAFIGFCSSITSDTISNSLRVLKTSKQTYIQGKNPSYCIIVKDIIEKDGIIGLFGRGLKVRLLTNGIQGIMFSVVWKLLENKLLLN
jgi:hypothetical protein